MTATDKMSREDLLATRKKVEVHLERLQYEAGPLLGLDAEKIQLQVELQDILTEINTELAEMDSKNA